jgi:hypothetical protein
LAYQPSPPRPITVMIAKMIVGMCDGEPPSGGGAAYDGLPLFGASEEDSGDGVMLIKQTPC